MSEELKPCTFCYMEAGGPFNMREERTCTVESEEIDDLLDATFTNLSCGHFFDGCKEFVNYCPKCGAKVVKE